MFVTSGMFVLAQFPDAKFPGRLLLNFRNMCKTGLPVFLNRRVRVHDSGIAEGARPRSGT